ncbi:MAG: M2 family metallopeptidase [Acidobacteriota bacterium]
MKRSLLIAVCAIAAVAVACGGGMPTATADDAQKFVAEANGTLLRLGVEQQQAEWVAENFITDDTEALGARASQALNDAAARYAKEAVRFDKVETAADVRRQLTLLKVALVLASPSDPKQAEEMSKLVSSMTGEYGKGKWCKDPTKPESCLDVGGVTEVLATSRDPKRLREVWEGWQTISVPMKKDYTRFVELANAGAKEVSFNDTGAMWRGKYDMPPDDFTKELDRLWEQVKPLYLTLHSYVRMKLHDKYGDAVPADGPIPAYMLGNIWSQDWSNVYPLVAPAGSDAGYSLTDILKKRNSSAVDMVKIGEKFYTSLGFAPLPDTFWQRSLITRPRDRDVVCHASAWDVDGVNDLRIKMCITPTEEDFYTIHHELGHNFYQRAYNTLPPLFRDSANDGFHEAIGDTIALSVTPEYLVKIGMLATAPDASHDTGLLMKRALEKISFLPFGLLVDQWRWQVFSGQVKPDQYNKAWWDLRTKYQGIVAPSVRGEEFFDAGSKYHVASVVPYTRYFLAAILQFQFHRALAKEAGCTLPLHRCSIYDSAAAGKKLNAMLSMGLSQSWQDALEAMTGSRQMDATAIIDYFAPLKTYMDAELAKKNVKVGW